MTSVISSVTNWLGGGTGPEDTSSEKGTPASQEEKTQKSPETDEITNERKEEKALDLDEISAAAMNTAKEWGSYLFSFGKEATKQVANTAKNLGSSVKDKTILGDFDREQEKFLSAQREKEKSASAAVAPWVGYNEEEQMKTQILALSQDQRNFLRNPPAGVQFQFDFEASHPVAMAMLQEDLQLKDMRFELVPKKVSEETFWRNYFYRVSLIKQSAQLTSLAQKTGGVSESEGKVEHSPIETRKSADARASEDLSAAASPPDQEFVSDSFGDPGAISEEDLRKEMAQLGVSKDANQDEADWERELQAELQEYEVVDDGANDAALEQELLRQIEAEQGGAAN